MDDARGRLTPYLLPDEALLWTGAPDPRRRFSSIDLFLVPFSLLWTGFIVFWLSAAGTAGAPVPFRLFGVPFLILGLYFVAGRFVVKARQKRRTVYGLTSGRALVAVGPGSLSEAPVHRTPSDSRRSRDGRHLTVTFGRQSASWASGPSYANSGMELLGRSSGPLAFYDVPDVAGLESALRAARG